MTVSEFTVSAILELRKEHKSCSAIARQFKISKSTASAWINKAEATLLENEKTQLRAAIAGSIKPGGRKPKDQSKQHFLAKHRALLLEVEELKNQLLKPKTQFSLDLLDALPTTDKGYIGELYIRYYLARYGVEVLLPQYTQVAHDLSVVGKSGKLYRCEVKAKVRGNCFGLSRSKFQTGNTFKTVAYTDEDKIDFFICVDLVNEQVAIIPWSEVSGDRKTITLSPDSRFWSFRDRVDLFV